MYLRMITANHRQIHTVMYQQITGTTETSQQTKVCRPSLLFRIEIVDRLKALETSIKEHVYYGAINVSLFLTDTRHSSPQFEGFHHLPTAQLYLAFS